MFVNFRATLSKIIYMCFFLLFPKNSSKLIAFSSNSNSNFSSNFNSNYKNNSRINISNDLVASRLQKHNFALWGLNNNNLKSLRMIMLPRVKVYIALRQSWMLQFGNIGRLLNCAPSDLTSWPNNSWPIVPLSVHWRALFPVNRMVLFFHKEPYRIDM